jgi:hypothetical protein
MFSFLARNNDRTDAPKDDGVNADHAGNESETAKEETRHECHSGKKSCGCDAQSSPSNLPHEHVPIGSSRRSNLEVEEEAVDAVSTPAEDFVLLDWQQTVFDLLRDIRDPEKSDTLDDLKVCVLHFCAWDLVF